jgi:CHAT domain-containing protein/Tfp pilus assembly protein PilF
MVPHRAPPSCHRFPHLVLILLTVLLPCAAQDQQDPAKAARAILDSTMPLIRNNQIDQAIQNLHEAYQLSVQARDGDLVVETCLYLGLADLISGDEQESQKAYETAVKLLVDGGANDRAIMALKAAVLLAEKKKRHDSQIRFLQMLADTYGRMSNLKAQADTLADLLAVYDKTTEMHAFCYTLEQQVLPLYQKLNDQTSLAGTWFLEGKCRENSKDIPGAIADYKKSIEAFRALGDKSSLAAVLDVTAETLRTQRRAAEALPLQKEAVALRRDLNVPRDYGQSLNDLAMTDEELGYLPDAVSAIEECVRITRTIKDPDALATALTNEAAVYRDVGRIDDALKALDESLQIARDNCLTDDARTAMKIRGTIYAVTGKTMEAAAAEAVANDTTDICAYKKKSEVPPESFPTTTARLIPAALIRTRGRFGPIAAIQSTPQAQTSSKTPSWIITDSPTPRQEVNALLESAAGMLNEKRTDDAIETLKKAIALAEKSGDKTILAAAYVWMGKAQLQNKNEAEGQRAIDRSVELIEDAHDQNDKAQAFLMAIDLGRENKLPATRAKYLTQLAVLYRDSGNLDEAKKKLDEALQVSRTACLTEQARSAFKVLATVHSAMGKAGNAAEDQALANDTANICADKPETPPKPDAKEPAYMNTHNMSVALVQMGAYGKAIDNFKAELKKAEDDHDPAGTVSAHEGLAYAYAESSQFTLAEANLLEAQRIERELANPRANARIQTNLAIVYTRMGRYYQALDVYNQVGKTAASLNDIQLQINTWLTTADLYRRLKSYDQAYEDAQQALQLIQKTGFRNLAAEAQQTMGLVELSRENYNQAEILFRESAKNGPDNALMNEGLVEVYLGTGRYDDAEKELGRVSAEALDRADSAYRLQYYTQRGIAQLELSRYTDAIDDFNSAIQQAEELRTQVQWTAKSSGFLDSGSFGGRVRPYRGMVEAFGRLAILGAPVKATIGTNETDASHAAFHFAELTRGRSLSEKMAVSRINEVRKEVPQSVLDEEKRLTDEVLRLAQQHRAEHPGSAATAAETEQFARLRADARAYFDNLEKNYPLYAAVFGQGTIPMDELPLAPDEALLEYAIGLNHVFVFVVSGDHTLKCYRLPANLRQMQAKVRAFRNLIASKRFSSVLAHDLFSSLLGAIPQYDQLPRRLIIVPDGFLALLPFDALNTAQAGDPRFIAAEHSIIYAQSASVLTWTRKFRRSPAGKPLFALADPIFAPSDSRLTVDSARPMASGSSMVAPDSAPPVNTFRRLPETETEVETLASILGIEPQPPDVLIGASATKARLEKTDLTSYRLLHFATHAVAIGEPGRVNEPFLVLNQVGNAPGDNGLLTMSEIMDLKLNSDLVVLSACDTGAGDVLEGDGVASLASAFQFAGADGVVLSLWELPSEATLPFMRAFYQKLKQGGTKAEALASGREAMRSQYPDPYYWAVFALYSGARS